LDSTFLLPLSLISIQLSTEKESWMPRLAVLAGGAELKNTFCLTRGAEAFLSEHIGDLMERSGLASFEAAIAHYEQFFEVQFAL